MHNLNTHYAYQDLRTVRAQELEQSDRVSGIKLARYLTAYAELGEKYVYVLQSMILQIALIFTRPIRSHLNLNV